MPEPRLIPKMVGFRDLASPPLALSSGGSGGRDRNNRASQRTCSVAPSQKPCGFGIHGFRDSDLRQPASRCKGFGSARTRLLQLAEALRCSQPCAEEDAEAASLLRGALQQHRAGPAAYVRLPKVITEDAPDNTDWEDVQDTTEAWFVQSYTTPVPTLSDDQMAEIDEIVGGL